MFVKIIFFIISCFVISFESTLYNGYKVIEMNLKTDQEIQSVFQLNEKYQTDIWKGPSKVISTHIMLSPNCFSDFTKALKDIGITYTIIIDDVQKTIDKENNVNNYVKFSRWKNPSGPIINDHFATFEEIMEWTEYLTKKFSFVSTNVYGKSYEGRDLKYVKLSTGSNRKSILVDGGIHAREWLAVSTVNYMLEKMISEYTMGKSNIVALLSKYDVYFIPVINPDGYVFTHTPGNRLWRKNRKPNYYNGRLCYGTDLNRNFDAEFGGSGTSSYPCDDLYRGPFAFSEPETKSFSKFVRSFGYNLKFYFSIHAYAQFWFVPFGYSRNLPDDNYEMRRVANIGNAALYKVNHEFYEVGTPPELLYAAAGGSFDWIKLKAAVKYAFTLEVRPSWGSGRGQQGFIAPLSDIGETGEEVYAGFIASVEAI